MLGSNPILPYRYFHNPLHVSAISFVSLSLSSSSVFELDISTIPRDITIEWGLWGHYDATAQMSVLGATGVAQDGYILHVDSLAFLGKKVENPQVGVYDFENFPGVDGLLGWDVISQLHIELNGPQGCLKIY